MSRALYTVVGASGISVSLWADSAKDAKLKALNLRVVGDAEEAKDGSMAIAVPVAALIGLVIGALLSGIVEHANGILTVLEQQHVSYVAPVDDGQKLTVFVKDGRETCQYSALGFGGKS